MESKVRKCRLFTYMLSATMGTLSNSYLYTIIHAFDDPLHEWFPYVFNPICLVLGGIIGILLLGLGRRKVLIAADIFLILISICGTFRHTFLIHFATPLVGVFFSFNYLIVLLFCKEIPPFRSNGIPIVFLNAFEFLGYSSCLAVMYYCNYCLRINIYAPSTGHIRLYIVLLGSIPALIQILLLLFVYKYEPPGYSVDQCSEEDAAASLAQIYSDPQVLGQEITRLKWRTDLRKFSGAGWTNTIFSTPKRKTSFLIMLTILLTNFLSGYYSYALPTTVLDRVHSAKLIMYSLFGFFCLISMFGLIIDRYPIHLLLRFGAVLSVVGNVACAAVFSMHIFYGGTEMLLCIMSTVESAVHMTFIVLPAYKFAVTNLLDKSLLLVIVIQFLGFMFYSYPISLTRRESRVWVAYGLQLGYLFGSVFLLIFVTKYVTKFTTRRKSDSTLLLSPQTGFSEDQ